MRVRRVAPYIVIPLIIMAIFLYVSTNYVGLRSYSVGLGIEFNTHATPVWIALDKRLFEKLSVGVNKVFKFRTGLELAAAIARGDVDVAWACLGPILKIIDKGIDVKIVMKIHDYGYAIVVNPKYIRSVEDLRNYDLYTTGKGAPAHLLILRIADTYGIRPKSIKFKPPSTILTGLLSGAIVAAALPEHYVSVATSHGLKVLIRSRDVWPNMPGSYLVVKSEVLKLHPGVVRKIVKITCLGINLIKHNVSYAALVDSKYLNINYLTALKSVKALEWTTKMNLSEIQDYINFMYRHGLLKHKLNARDIVEVIECGCKG